MNNKYNFPPIRKPKGSGRAELKKIAVGPEFHAALNDFVKWRTKVTGVKTSVRNVVETAMIKRYPELKAKHEQLRKEKERQDAKKYLDGIKSQHKSK